MGIMKREMERLAERHSYYVVMREFRTGREAIVDPEITRREVVSRIVSGEYSNVVFIHHVETGNFVVDVTEEIMAEARPLMLVAAE